MAWNFRRSINLGPLRINVSKSGIGYSAGVRGFRIGKDAKGRKYTATSIPGTGIYRREYQKNATPQSQPVVNAPPTPPHGGNTAGSNLRIRDWCAYLGGAFLLYLLIRALS